MSPRRALAAALLAAASALSPAVLPAAPAAAAPDARSRYVLPGPDVFPEGIAVWSGQYYVTSTTDGSILRGDLRERRATPFIEADQGQFGAVGLKATADFLVVAGGPTGTVTVYDRRTGERRARFRQTGDSPTFVNDVAVAPNGDVYATDSFRPVVYRIPAAGVARRQAGVQELPVVRDLRGTPLRYLDGAFNANGIVVTPGGRSLLIVNAATGGLYRIRLDSGSVTQVDVAGGALTGGDGLVLLDSRVLYVVRNGATEAVTEVRLSSTFRRGRVVSSTTSSTFDFPTTAAVAGDRLLVVNSQFGALLGGQEPTPPFTVTGLPLP